ncbi:Uncharacterised protein [Serratia entomophila]|nr:Uncharacterised protein [Serratia entomophila]
MQTTPLPDNAKFWHALTVFLLVFAVCLLGILSRPSGFLAAFWPANAVLLAVLVRNPEQPRVMAGAWRLSATFWRIC